MKAALQCKPSPPSSLGGEGWVRGQRNVLPQRLFVFRRCPLTPPLSPNGEAVGGEGGT